MQNVAMRKFAVAISAYADDNVLSARFLLDKLQIAGTLTCADMHRSVQTLN